MDEQRNTQPAENTRQQEKSRTKKSAWKKPPVIIIGTAVIAAIFYHGLNHLVFSFAHESTDNAFLQSDIISVAPQISGQVQKVFVNDNQRVHAGDPLVEIDPSDYEVQLAQKKAALAAAKANVAMIKASFDLLAAQVKTAEATARQSEAESAADRAKLEQAKADLNRAEDLHRRDIISPQEYDATKAAADAAIANYNAGEQKALSDKSKIAAAQAQLTAGRRAMERAEAQAGESEVDLRQAELNLSYTRITAPAEGRVTRKSVEPGDYLHAGQKIMALVLNDLWVTANFKETQLKNIRTNQPAIITVDSVGGREFAGHVQSIQAGSGAAFSLLPPENAVGNYVKVVQRVPVKIVFNNPIEAGHVLGPGMSAVPAVRTSDFHLPDVIIAAIAIVLAAIVGFLWWKAAQRKQPAANG